MYWERLSDILQKNWFLEDAISPVVVNKIISMKNLIKNSAEKKNKKKVQKNNNIKIKCKQNYVAKIIN